MVSHAFHMAEIWDHAAKQYKIVEKLLDPESDICGCVTDIENNDILNFLNVLAFQMKYPGITTGNKTITDFCEYPISVVFIFCRLWVASFVKYQEYLIIPHITNIGPEVTKLVLIVK